jgi:hypothetical protein
VLLLDELTTFLDADDQRGVLEAVRAAVDGPERVTALWVRLHQALRTPMRAPHFWPALTPRSPCEQVTHRLEELEFADGASCMEAGTIVRGHGACLTDSPLLVLRCALTLHAPGAHVLQVRSGTGAEMRQWIEEQAQR